MIIENILPNRLQKEIYDLITGFYFAWFYNDTSTINNDSLFQFTHTFYIDNQINSDKYNLIIPILWFFEKETNIKIKSVLRIKANLNTKYVMNEKNKIDAIHKDIEKSNYLSLIYYVNDSDGDTLIYNDNGKIEHKITPKQNSLIYFNSNKNHAGIFPINNKKRIIINFVVEIEPN